MIESIWSILGSRYSDLDSWLDLKYLGASLVEKITHQQSIPSPSPSQNKNEENIYETLANLGTEDPINELENRFSKLKHNCEYKISC